MITGNVGASYEELRRQFRWRLPEDFNMGVACADRHPRSSPAVVDLTTGGGRRE